MTIFKQLTDEQKAKQYRDVGKLLIIGTLVLLTGMITTCSAAIIVLAVL